MMGNSRPATNVALIATLLTACAEAPPALSDNTLPPPGDLTIDGDHVAFGDALVVHISGAQVGERVGAVLSTTGLGPDTCPPGLGGACLELALPFQLVGTPYTDADGSVSLTLTVPVVPSLDGAEVCWQAVALRGAQASLTEVSPPFCHRVGFDTDGDGVPNVVDRCPGSDDHRDSDGDLIPDGCDTCFNDDFELGLPRHSLNLPFGYAFEDVSSFGYRWLGGFEDEFGFPFACWSTDMTRAWMDQTNLLGGVVDLVPEDIDPCTGVGIRSACDMSGDSSVFGINALPGLGSRDRPMPESDTVAILCFPADPNAVCP
jgi:hypothetical protein